MKRPNVILINCDDLGYGDLGCYGSELNRTPAIDALAADGTRFTDFYMASPVCSPSRAAMLTGCYPTRIGFGEFDGRVVLFPGQGIGLDPDETTVADVFKDAGYRTKIVGKWHCGDQPRFLPCNYGFDEYYGLPYSNDMGRQSGRAEQFPPLPLIKDGEVIQQQPDQRALTERYVEQSLEFISAACGEPFFLYLAHMHVHLPLYAAEPFVRASANGDYGACVAAVDWATDCIVRKLAEKNLTDDTMIIFTSDNGSRGDHGASNAPLRGGKQTTWEGGMRVPFIIKWPGRVPAGRVSGEMFASIDLFPTLAALCGIEHRPEKKIDGENLSGLVRGERGREGRATFFYYRQNGLEAVRRGDWKLHVRKRGEREERVGLLYDLRADIGETADLYGERPDVVAELSALLDAAREELGDSYENIIGSGVRECARVEDARPLTEYDEDHPYICAMYDKSEVG